MLLFLRKNIDFQGKISIDIVEDNDYIYTNITDNGVGFEHVDKEKMLTPYFTTKAKGSGLGLSVVVKIINDHDFACLQEIRRDVHLTGYRFICNTHSSKSHGGVCILIRSNLSDGIEVIKNLEN